MNRINMICDDLAYDKECEVYQAWQEGLTSSQGSKASREVLRRMQKANVASYLDLSMSVSR